MGGKHVPRLGPVQETLFIPLIARARDYRQKRPILRDPKAAEIAEAIDFDSARFGRAGAGWVVLLRTAIFDAWVRDFLAEHPSGTVVEIGAGLNGRFERVDNGTAHWIDMDLPDTIELRKRFFADSDRRRTVASSVTDDDWLRAARDSPGPCFFVSEGVLVYLGGSEVAHTLTRLAESFPGARLAFDTYSTRSFAWQHRMAAKRDIQAPWRWACDDPRSLEHFGMRLVDSVTFARPPAAVRERLPALYRHLLPLADPIVGKTSRLSLFQIAS